MVTQNSVKLLSQNRVTILGMKVVNLGRTADSERVSRCSFIHQLPRISADLARPASGRQHAKWPCRAMLRARQPALGARRPRRTAAEAGQSCVTGDPGNEGGRDHRVPGRRVRRG